MSDPLPVPGTGTPEPLPPHPRIWWDGRDFLWLQETIDHPALYRAQKIEDITLSDGPVVELAAVSAQGADIPQGDDAVEDVQSWLHERSEESAGTDGAMFARTLTVLQAALTLSHAGLHDAPCDCGCRGANAVPASSVDAAAAEPPPHLRMVDEDRFRYLVGQWFEEPLNRDSARSASDVAVSALWKATKPAEDMLARALHDADCGCDVYDEVEDPRYIDAVRAALAAPRPDEENR